jgi:hypothetical protein
VVDQTGTQSTNFEFDAGQIGNTSQGGNWPGSQPYYYQEFYTATGGDANGFEGLDYALIEMPPVNGTYIGDALGGFSILGGATESEFLEEGYPTEGWFGTNCPNSTTNLTCYVWDNWGPVADYRPIPQANGWYQMVMGGYINGGSSGGPIFQYYNGSWRITSVTSRLGILTPYTLPDGSTGRWYGQNIISPEFNQYVLNLWNAHAIT